jgi:formate hydrogenlyase transcriptional activator
LEHERNRWRLLLEVSESIASHRDVAALLHDLAQRMPRIVPFDVVNVVLHDPVRNSMRLHALVAPEFNKTRPGLEFSMDETTSKFVWENQQPVMVEDVEAEKNFPRLDGGVAREWRALLLHCSLDLAVAPAGRHVIRQRAKTNL